MAEGGASGSDEQPRKRPIRACTARTPSRLAREAPAIERYTGSKRPPKEIFSRSAGSRKLSKPAEVVEPMVLVSPPGEGERERWQLRSMWELASIFNFLKTFRSLLTLDSEHSFNELESSLLAPNRMLEDLHIALLKGIPPVSRTPIGRDIWVKVLFKKLKDRWSWVAEGSCPNLISSGDEALFYKELDPATRVKILKALCEIRLDQDDFRSHVDESLKHGCPISVFRMERLMSDAHGTTYWYEKDSISGHRLYRRLQKKVETKTRGKFWGHAAPSPVDGQWETLATCVEEFQSVAEKLALSKSRLEVEVGNTIQIDIIPELEEIQKKKERAIKRQQRQVLLLDNVFYGDGLAGGRSRRDRKPVTYTFDEYDRSINEAINFTKKRHSPEPIAKPIQGDRILKNESVDSERDDLPEANGTFHTENLHEESEEKEPSKSRDESDKSESDKSDQESPHALGSRSERHRRRPQRYSDRDFVEAAYNEDDDHYSDDEIEGEAVYYEDDDDDDGVQGKRNKAGSDTDEEYRGEEDLAMEEEEDDDDEDAATESEDSDEYASLEDGFRERHSSRNRRNVAKGTRKLKLVGELGLRRSQRSTRSVIDYSKYEGSDFEEEASDRDHKSRRLTKASSARSEDSFLDMDEDPESESFETQKEDGEGRSDDDGDGDDDDDEMDRGKLESIAEKTVLRGSENGEHGSGNEQHNVSLKRQFLDLNQLAPSGPEYDMPTSNFAT